MKKILLTAFSVAVLCSITHAQQWTGNNNTTDPIDRSGKVSIGGSYGDKLEVSAGGQGGGGITTINEQGVRMNVFNNYLRIGAFSGVAGFSGAALVGDNNSSNATQHSNLGIFAGTGKNLVLGGNKSAHMSILANGNVGIGISTPTQALSVNGSIDATGWLFMGADLQMKRNDAVNGNTYRRALVHGFNKELVLNYGGDFSNGVYVDVRNSAMRIDGTTSVNFGIGRVSLGHAYGPTTNWGIGYMGFNMERNATAGTWMRSNDGANNGSAVVYGNVGGDIYFSSFTSSGATDKTNTDKEVYDNIKMKILGGGQVAIGAVSSTPAGYKLYVEQGILTEKVKVALKNTTDWADYVFADTYQLRPLAAVESYIQKNKHLPDVPSAQEMVNTGLDVAKTDAMLLQKIEELTLYVIELNKSLQAEKKDKDARIAELMQQIEQLKK